MMETVAIIQARMGSSRLPGKVLMKIQGIPMIKHIIERTKQAKRVGRIVVATSTEPVDDPLAEYLNSNGVICFRGSQNNVLERFYEANKIYGGDPIVRLTGDNPLIDPKIIDKTIEYYFRSGCKYVSDIKPQEGISTLPLGIACEVFSSDLLKEAYHCAQDIYEKEHVTPYMYYKQNSVGCYPNEANFHNYRLTVDTTEDFMLIKEIYAFFFKGDHDFYLEDIIEFLSKRPELVKINENISQRKIVPNKK